MSEWKEITDPDDIEIIGEEIHILTGHDDFGNKYVTFKKSLLYDKIHKDMNEENERLKECIDDIYCTAGSCIQQTLTDMDTDKCHAYSNGYCYNAIQCGSFKQVFR
jgi:hypothetical protein